MMERWSGEVQVNVKSQSELDISGPHFPTELKQCRKFDQRSDTCFLKAKRVYKKTSLTVKSNNLGFWSYFVSKLRNFETRFQAPDTWPRVI